MRTIDRSLSDLVRGRSFARLLCSLLVFAVLAAFNASVQAGPAARVVKDFVQPDGTVVELHLWGDEFVNGWETIDGYAAVMNLETRTWEYAIRDESGILIPSGVRVGDAARPAFPGLRPSAAAIDAARAVKGVPPGGEPLLKAAPGWASGTTNVLVIMVQFPADAGDPDGAQPAVNCSFSAAQMQANLFGGTATGPGNLSDYYDEVSFGALNLVGTVVGCFTVAHDKDDYDDGPSSAAALVQEAIQLADATVDFAPFDNDSDGNVDFVAVAYAGGGPDNGVYNGADPNDNRLWPHASSISSVSVDGGARSVSEYYIAAELRNNVPTIRTIGVYAHELGHKLGLPDLYDTGADSNGIGHWGLMGSGSWNSDIPGIENGEAPAHMSAWSKWFEGWITPTDLTGLSTVQNIPEAANNPFAAQVLANPGGVDWAFGSSGSGEYFLVENRQQTGFDVGLDGCGLLVWHIDEGRPGNNNANASQGHTSGSHRLVDLEEAHGGTEDLDLQPWPGPGNRGDAGDPYPGTSMNMVLDDTTSPHCRLYDGSNTGLRMYLIDTACAPTMQVSFGNAPPTCDANGVYFGECEGATTTVGLDGTGSSDPDASDTLTYSWASDCPGASFDDATSATPALDVDTSTGCLINCSATLTVTDEAGASESCSSPVLISDSTDPSIDCPDDEMIECGLGTDPMVTGSPVVVDVCDPMPTVDHADVVTPGVCPQEEQITRTFTATDRCTNDSDCTQVINVTDETAPGISCNAPSTIVPSDAPIAFTATAADNCDGAPSVTIAGYDCYMYTKKGRRISKLASCEVAIDGTTVSILDSGGVGDFIMWSVIATDACGNVAIHDCEVEVINPGHN